MEGFEIIQTVVGPVSTNCYILHNIDTNQGLIVDPGAEASRLENLLLEKKITPAAILLTHGHFDHVGAAEELADRFDIKIYALDIERETIEDPMVNLSFKMGRDNKAYRADEYVRDAAVLDMIGTKIQVISTPGHTAGSACYYVEDLDLLFSGDTLFAESVGRTDFPNGSSSAIVRSVRDKLFALPDKTLVLPGHGPRTSIAYEKEYNPYV